jgi:tetratricopeptide (TPR) repeat protein
MTETMANVSAETAFEEILALAKKGSGIADFIQVAKDTDKKLAISLTKEGEALDRTWQQASRLAEEKGMEDREVRSLVKDVESKWPSYPGIVENAINDAIEQEESAKAVETCEKALAEWSSTMSKGGVKSAKDLATKSEGAQLFVQLLANYEFALERADRVEEALSIAMLTRDIEPADPENVLSSIVALEIRRGNPMAAIVALESVAESLAPYVLYGRALAYFALGQHENASGALQAALRHWPQVAESLTREWKGGTPMPKPGEAVSELQVLYGYYEVFGPSWKSVPGAIEWLREESTNFVRSGAKPQRYVGLTRSGLRTDAQGNIVLGEQAQQTEEQRAKEQEDLIKKAQVIGSDDFVRFLEVRPNEFVYVLTTRGKELEDKHTELYRKDMKIGARLEAVKELLAQWPGHANAAIALARYYGQKERFEDAIAVLEPAIFDLQKFWSEDDSNFRLTADWVGNKPLLTAYAYMVLDLAESGDRASAKAYAADYLKFNPADQMGVRQKAIELAISDGEYPDALRLINEAGDPMSAYNVFGRALLGFVLKANDSENALKNAVENRPLVWREMNADKHRMPHGYNPSFVKYFSAEEAYNYQQVWGSLWLKKHGALAWLKKEGRKYVK